MGALFLVGPRGSGKSLAAKLLAERRACTAWDTDQMVVETKGASIADIVEQEGWAAFRAAEREALCEAARRAHNFGGACVVATGGGAVLDPENRRLMRAKGEAAYLAIPEEPLIRRLRQSRGVFARPPLSDLSFEEEIRAVLAERDPLYRETARYLVNADMPARVVAGILCGILRTCKDTQ